MQTSAVFDNVDSVIIQIALPLDHFGQSWILWLTAIILNEVFCCIGVLDNVDFSMNFIDGFDYSMMPVSQECSNEKDMVSALHLVH